MLVSIHSICLYLDSQRHNSSQIASEGCLMRILPLLNPTHINRDITARVLFSLSSESMFTLQPSPDLGAASLPRKRPSSFRTGVNINTQRSMNSRTSTIRAKIPEWDETKRDNRYSSHIASLGCSNTRLFGYALPSCHSTARVA